ncbi:glutamyl-tRNA synthetase [Paenibacillus phyllosphaerae]|uniref:Glutamyl-Q tRNA(Asp) synthetase n=1 Tax=Paenibacillus phyllosphaerae TaxID=274593 RepID=A0A7W5FLR1_9BACL|nr:tRNA glutamyl-Q(34) synthetase GluQRS [Paenibacillus phyllosphaerae]MBB3109495.1 glutamyl-tRNA synthetase [Paenibacillus phyllosphaerae]
MSHIRGRFAPTPSGYMHIGNARTALLSWLQIRSMNGSFIMRMEDIDKPRCKPELAEQALADLRWLGLDWDEGPDMGGPHAPYTQSEREHLYASALDQLEQQHLLYPCYCSRAELLSIASAPHGLGSEGPVYPGTCSRLTEAERAERALSKTPSLRFRAAEGPYTFHDETAGWQTFAAGGGGDFVVRRADGIISYQLAVVVDDAAMGVTDVLRGYDLLDSTPRQLMLYEALGLPAPRFAHVPLLNGTDGKRLAKRHGSIALASLREAGVSPERIIGWLAALSGLLPQPEPVRASELVSEFALDRIPKEAVVVTDELMRYLTG